MDDVWVGWEARLFRLESRAMGAGGHVSHEDALRQVSLGTAESTPVSPNARGQPVRRQVRCAVCLALFTRPCLTWQRSMTSVRPHTPDGGDASDVSDGGLQAQAASLRRITQGGLNEASAVGAAGLESSLGEAGRRDREVVSTVDIVRHPSEAEQIMRMLPGQLRGLKALRPRAGPPSPPPAVPAPAPAHHPSCST